MRSFVYFIMFILSICSVFALDFDKDTTFTEGNYKYVFKKGIEIDNFDIQPGGIKINGDQKIGLDIEGGQLTLIFHEFNDDIKNISFISTVPQTIDFTISVDGVFQYLYDGSVYHKNSYEIGLEEVYFTFSDFVEKDINKIEDNIELGDSTEKLPWYKKKIFEFEVTSYMDENGIIHNKTFAFTYLSFGLIFILLSIIGLILWSLRN